MAKYQELDMNKLSLREAKDIILDLVSQLEKLSVAQVVKKYEGRSYHYGIKALVAYNDENVDTKLLYKQMSEFSDEMFTKKVVNKVKDEMKTFNQKRNECIDKDDNDAMKALSDEVVKWIEVTYKIKYDDFPYKEKYEEATSEDGSDE